MPECDNAENLIEALQSFVIAGWMCLHVIQDVQNVTSSRTEKCDCVECTKFEGWLALGDKLALHLYRFIDQIVKRWEEEIDGEVLCPKE